MTAFAELDKKQASQQDQKSILTCRTPNIVSSVESMSCADRRRGLPAQLYCKTRGSACRTLISGHRLGGTGGLLQPCILPLVNVLAQAEPHKWLRRALCSADIRHGLRVFFDLSAATSDVSAFRIEEGHKLGGQLQASSKEPHDNDAVDQ